MPRVNEAGIGGMAKKLLIIIKCPELICTYQVIFEDVWKGM